jgi:hypothetical protein
MNNNILIKYGSTDPSKVLDLMDINSPEYIPYALRHKKYDRICIKDLKIEVKKIEFRNQNLFNIINKNNDKINEMKKYINSVVMKD